MNGQGATGEELVMLHLRYNAFKIHFNSWCCGCKEFDIIAEKYDVLFSVDAVNNLVIDGKAFRDAYKIVGGDIAEGKFRRPVQLNYQHLGSIGNLANEQIAQLMDSKLAQFNFEKVAMAIEALTL